MEGEDSDKLDQQDDKEAPPPPEDTQQDQPSSTPSLPSSRATSVQPTPVASSLIKAQSTPPNSKTSFFLRTLAAKPAPSEKTMTSSSAIKASSIKFTADALDEADERGAAASRPQGRISTKSKSVLAIAANLSGLGAFPVSFLSKRSPFVHNPPEPEERRERIQFPRTPREYIINLREDLADFQESHGLPRTRDYSFVSLGLALAQETARAVYSVFLMFAELFPILAIVSLILRFALDKLIEILETPDPVVKLKKAIIFGLEMLVIVIPLWILIGTIVLPLVSLIFSIFKRVLRFKGGKKKKESPCKSKPKPKVKPEMCDLFFTEILGAFLSLLVGEPNAPTVKI